MRRRHHRSRRGMVALVLLPLAYSVGVRLGILEDDWTNDPDWRPRHASTMPADRLSQDNHPTPLCWRQGR